MFDSLFSLIPGLFLAPICQFVRSFHLRFGLVHLGAQNARRRCTPTKTSLARAMVSTRHAKVEEPEPGSSTRSGKRPKETSPETAPLLAHEMLSAPSPVAASYRVWYS